MPLEMQTRLLRVLQERVVQRLGGSRDISMTARVIATTHRDLETAVEEGAFRLDLFHRLRVVHLRLPSLRERRGDIPLLASYFIDRFNREFRKRVRGLSPAAQALLEQYQWPGNIRELRNAIERAMLLIDQEWLAQALERAGGNQTKAALLLGINRDQVRYRLEKFGLKA